MRACAQIVQDLKEDGREEERNGKTVRYRGHFTLDVKQRQAALTELGLETVHSALGKRLDSDMQ